MSIVRRGPEVTGGIGLDNGRQDRAITECSRRCRWRRALARHFDKAAAGSSAKELLGNRWV